MLSKILFTLSLLIIITVMPISADETRRVLIGKLNINEASI